MAATLVHAKPRQGHILEGTQTMNLGITKEADLVNFNLKPTLGNMDLPVSRREAPLSWSGRQEHQPSSKQNRPI